MAAPQVSGETRINLVRYMYQNGVDVKNGSIKVSTQ
ncbi:hypothetical protein C8D96_1193 [Kushneria marisflavi]|nr:hypothetical protein C8D96_1193 [Kushneria marisflavi]